MGFVIKHGSDRHLGGYWVINDPEAAGGKSEGETYQCCHCNAHYDREVGQGPKAMCLMCYAPTCGQKPCDPCVPFEAKLEAREAMALGRRRLYDKMQETLGLR